MSKALTVSKQDVLDNMLIFNELPIRKTALFSLPSILSDRFECETDLTRLQLIPYITLIDSKTKKVFIYTRGKDNGDGRLTGKCSIGLGGHIELEPNNDISLLDVILIETARELIEEVGLVLDDVQKESLETTLTNGLFNIIYTEIDEVSSVHLGVSLILEVDARMITSKEEQIITETNWIDIKNYRDILKRDDVELEVWSEIVLFNLFAMK